MRRSHGREARSPRSLRLVFAFAFGSLAANLAATASPIKGAGNTTTRMTDFEKFLDGGPAHWATTHPATIPAGVNVFNPDGTLKDNRVVDYLMWRRDRHPATFDHRHPTVGPRLAARQEERGTTFMVYPSSHGPSNQAESIHANAATPLTASPTAAQMLRAPQVALETLSSTPGYSPGVYQETSSSSVVTTHVYPGGEPSPEGSPEAIPEPSSVAIALLMFGSAACWNRRRSRRPMCPRPQAGRRGRPSG